MKKFIKRTYKASDIKEKIDKVGFETADLLQHIYHSNYHATETSKTPKTFLEDTQCLKLVGKLSLY